MKDQAHNLNPHASAIAAIYIYGAEYSKHWGGSMDFWNSLSEYKKNVCRRLVAEVVNAPKELAPEPTDAEEA